MIRRRAVKAVMILLLGFMVFNPPVLFALSKDDIHAIQNNSVWHKIYTDACAGSATPTTSSSSATSGPAKSGPVYLVGDSIGTQIISGLQSALGTNGWSFQGNAVSGRTLPEGIAAIDQDQDYIKTATAIIVELGTNTAGFSADTVGQMINKLRALNPTANIYWVDTAVVERQDYAGYLDTINSVIYSQAGANNYQVISWNKKVFGASADPTNINASAPDNGYIRHADEYVHLTDQGASAMVDLLNSTVAGTGSGQTASAACGGGGATCLPGGDNQTKVWNYFVAKGLGAIQVAAIMGNLQVEAGFNPSRVEDGWGFPSEMDTMPPNVGPQGQPGYGIAQWTSPGRKQGLADLASSSGKAVNDLGLQLDYLWQELNTGYQGVLNDLKQATTIEDTTRIFGNGYEGFGSDTLATRTDFATFWMTQFGSVAPSAGTSC